MIPRDGQAAPAKPRARSFGKPAVLYEAGVRHLRAGAHLDAQLCGQQALAMDPHHADTMHLMGLITLHANRLVMCRHNDTHQWLTVVSNLLNCRLALLELLNELLPSRRLFKSTYSRGYP